MDKVLLEAKVRESISKSHINQMRKNGKVPGVFYSKHHEPISIEVSERALNPLVFTAKTNLISLKVDNQDTLDCIIKDIQFDPVTDRVIHFDLIGLQKGEKVEIEVPVQLIGSAVGVKEGGQLQHILHKIQLECLPSDIPEHIEINVTNLKIGDAVHIKDLNVPNVSFSIPEDSIVVSVTHAKVEKEPVPADELEEAAEPEVIGKGKDQEDEEEKD